MSETFLDKIVGINRARVAVQRRDTDMVALRQEALDVRTDAAPHLLQAALLRRDGINIIAEIKRASPSKGVINADMNVAELAGAYENGGAVAISVLTENEFFGGSLDDLRAVRSSVDLPILRKDFIVDEVQVFEAAVAGADAVLLIVAALNEKALQELLRLVQDDLRMDAIVEVHTVGELKVAARVGANIIGVNNRDLHSLTVSLDTSRELIAHRPENALMVAESGLSTRDEIAELRALGFDGFLIGETLMRSGDPAAALRELMI